MSPKSKKVKATKSKCKTVSKRRVSGGGWFWSSSEKPADGTTTKDQNMFFSMPDFSSIFGSFQSPQKEEQPTTTRGGKKRSKKSHTSRKNRKTNKNAAK